jgi:hypothetical protein
MKRHDVASIEKLLKQALPPVERDAEPARDLWPAVLRRLDAEADPVPAFGCAWLDCTLLAGIAAFAVFFPASIPMLLYCL